VKLKNKLYLLFEFYKSSFVLSFAIFNVFIIKVNSYSSIFIFCFLGVFLTAFFKELYRKENFLFYNNQGISRVHLYLFVYLLNIFLSFLILFIFNETFIRS